MNMQMDFSSIWDDKLKKTSSLLLGRCRPTIFQAYVAELALNIKHVE